MEQAVKESIDIKKMLKLPIINTRDAAKKLSEKEEKSLRELGNFEFFNLEEPGLMQQFSYGTAGNVMKFTFLHGHRYKVPRFIARHIESRSTPIWKWKPDGYGSLHKERAGEKSRFQMREIYE